MSKKQTQAKTGKVSRRSFFGSTAALAAAIPLQPLLGGKESAAQSSVVPYPAFMRTEASLAYRTATALSKRIDVGQQPDNGDATRFTDFSGNYGKALMHDGLGVPNKAAFENLIHAFQTGKFSDFENISWSGRPEADRIRRKTDLREH